jgi:quercetin dioxygenase-like cupin family protein
MSHPTADPSATLAPILIGEIWENPVTGERAKVVELPWQNPERRVVAELTAGVGSRVVGEHRHPGIVERFEVLQGELTVRLDGTASILSEGQASEVRPGHWHDWWNAADTDALVRVEVTPGERFMHAIETLFGLAQLGHTNDKGVLRHRPVPNPAPSSAEGHVRSAERDRRTLRLQTDLPPAVTHREGRPLGSGRAVTVQFAIDQEAGRLRAVAVGHGPRPLVRSQLCSCWTPGGLTT